MAKTKSPTSRSRERFRWIAAFENNVIWGLLGVGISFLGVFFSVFVSIPRETFPRSDITSTIQRLLIFTAALTLLNFIIVGFATFIGRKNREVISLKRRLSEIYSSALRKSALNPQLKSPTSDE